MYWPPVTNSSNSVHILWQMQGGNRDKTYTIWPGTHKIIYDLMIRTEGLARNEGYKQQLIDFNSNHCVEGWGEAGDILLWHRLLTHTAGWNRSETLQLREAVLCDYAHREAKEPKAYYEDMWEDWSDELRTAIG